MAAVGVSVAGGVGVKLAGGVRVVSIVAVAVGVSTGAVVIEGLGDSTGQ